MKLSNEQERKIRERLEWLVEDTAFRRSTRHLVNIIDAVPVVEQALRRFEEEKIAITAHGRYQDQCDELVANADAFFSNYSQEIKQIGLSVFRFAHRVLEDHLGEDAGLRAFVLGKGSIMGGLNMVFSAIRLLVVDNKVQ
jgi:hypothetical protein